VTFAAQTDAGTRTLVIVIMLVMLGVIGWAINRSKREDPSTLEITEAVSHAAAD